MVQESERRLRDSYENDAERELGILDDTSSLLTLVMGAVGGRTTTIDVDKAGVPSGEVDGLKLMALQFMGIRAVRVVRAARATLASSYEPETRALDRILVELLAHRRAILDDSTGKAAFDWLKGKGRARITEKVAAMAPPDLYGNLSRDSHGDPAAVLALIDPATNVLALEPRRTPATRASLDVRGLLSRPGRPHLRLSGHPARSPS